MSFNIVKNNLARKHELSGKIKSVTSATTVGAVFIYDTSQDSDGGAWRKKCKGLSWFDEAASATRSARSEFPAMALIVADNAGTITVYDLDDPAMPLWMQFTGGSSNLVRNASELNAVTAKNGIIYEGGGNPDSDITGTAISFVEDRADYLSVSYANTRYNGNISERNAGNSFTSGGKFGAIVNVDINDIAATVIEGAEIGALGLPIPTVAVATDGGVSVIHPSGDVYDQTHVVYTDAKSRFLEWDDKGGLYFGNRASSTNGDVYMFYERNTLFANSAAAPTKIYHTLNTSLGTVNLLGGVVPITALSVFNNSQFATGGNNGLSLVKYNTGNPDEGAVAYITSTYNTGYMVGDIRFAGLANSRASDRSVKANHLASTGTVPYTEGLGVSAEQTEYGPFSASNYLSKSYHSSLDLGTTCTVMAWVKTVASGAYQTIASFNTASLATGWQLLLNADEDPYLYVYGATANVSSGEASPLTAGQWQHVVGVNDGARSYIYVDGKLANSTAGVAGSMNNGAGILKVGIRYNDTLPWLGSLSLVRVSATVSTPTQIKEIYDAEKPLFSANSLCLLQSSDSYNNVESLSFDKSSDLLTVGHGSGGYSATDNNGATIFRGLEAVDTFKGTDVVGVYHVSTNPSGWNNNTIKKLSTAGGVSAFGRTDGNGGTILDLPALDVRADLNTGDGCELDDGKFHFSGVTVNATPTDIGQIPIAENEQFQLVARVAGVIYNSLGHSDRIDAEIKQPFNRDFGGNVTAESVMSSLIEGAAGFDVVFETDTTAQTVGIKVTGSSGLRTVWTASVEVQRISDKKYER